jgi:hypothetical protein
MAGVLNIITLYGEHLNFNPEESAPTAERVWIEGSQQYGIRGWLDLFRIIFNSSSSLFEVFTRKRVEVTDVWGETTSQWEPRFDMIHLLLALTAGAGIDLPVMEQRLKSFCRSQESVRRVLNSILFQHRENPIFKEGCQLSNLMTKWKVTESVQTLVACRNEMDSRTEYYNAAIPGKQKKEALVQKKRASSLFKSQRDQTLNLLVEVQKSVSKNHPCETDPATGININPEWELENYVERTFPSESGPRKLRDESFFFGFPYNQKKAPSKNWNEYRKTYYATFFQEFSANPFRFIAMLHFFEVLINFSPSLVNNSLTRDDVAKMVWKVFAFRMYAPHNWMKFTTNDRRVVMSEGVWKSKRREGREIVTKRSLDYKIHGFQNCRGWELFNLFQKDLDNLGIGKVVCGNFRTLYEKMQFVQKNGDGRRKKLATEETNTGKIKNAHYASFTCRVRKEAAARFSIQQNGNSIGESLIVPAFKLVWSGKGHVDVFRKKFIRSPDGTSGKWTEEFCGYINPSGEFYGTYVLFETRERKDQWIPGDGDLVKLLRVLNHNFVEATAELGKLTGNCCCCSSELSDYESLAKGFGPVCEKRWDLTVDNKFSYLESGNGSIFNAPTTTRKRSRVRT